MCKRFLSVTCAIHYLFNSSIGEGFMLVTGASMTFSCSLSARSSAHTITVLGVLVDSSLSWSYFSKILLAFVKDKLIFFIYRARVWNSHRVYFLGYSRDSFLINACILYGWISISAVTWILRFISRFTPVVALELRVILFFLLLNEKV